MDTRSIVGSRTAPLTRSNASEALSFVLNVDRRASTRRSWPRPSSEATRTTTVEAGPEIVVDDRRRRTREFFVRMRREIEANTDDVGAKFPQVARAIHLGDEPERAIRGRASLSEAKSLLEDGIEVLPLPMLEDELN